jgi:hypothetical protein
MSRLIRCDGYVQNFSDTNVARRFVDKMTNQTSKLTAVERSKIFVAEFHLEYPFPWKKVKKEDDIF